MLNIGNEKVPLCSGVTRRSFLQVGAAGMAGLWLPDLMKLEASGAPLTMAPGAPWTVCITPGPNQVLYASDAYPGRVYKLSLDGKVLGVLGESGKQLKQFGWVNEIACPAENVLYVAELLNWRVQKLLLKPR